MRVMNVCSRRFIDSFVVVFKKISSVCIIFLRVMILIVFVVMLFVIVCKLSVYLMMMNKSGVVNLVYSAFINVVVFLSAFFISRDFYVFEMVM